MKHSLLIAAIAALVAGCATPVEEPAPKPAACATQGALTDLTEMRDVVKQAMVYPLGGGVPVEQVYEALKPRAEAAVTRQEHLRVLEEFVYQIGDHHAHLSTNDSLSPRLVPSGASVWVEQRDGKLVVVEIMPAMRQLREAGLREGMVVETVDGVAAAQAFPPIAADAAHRDAMIGFAARVGLAGTRAHQPKVTAVGSDGRRVELVIPALNASDGDALASLSFPRADVAVIRLNNSIGNSDLTPVFDGLMKQAAAAKTVILDLRNTPSGGDSVVAKPLMAWFVEGTKGYQKHESAEKSWVEQVEGRKDRFAGKLIVLVDHWTGSMGEGAAIGLRAAAGATLVGTPMAGLRGAIAGFDVPCLGIGFRVPIERLYEVNGTPRELAKPDVLVTERELAEGTGDVILEKALALAR
jgi:C-terminal processing protease CtpA/Prc